MTKISQFCLMLGIAFFSTGLLANTSLNNPFGEPVVETIIDDGVPCFEPTLPCREPTGLLVDQYLSPFVGAEAMIFGLRIYQAIDDAFVPSTLGDTNLYTILGRTAKFALEATLASTFTSIQHEFFGFGFRGREFHVKKMRFHIAPWGGSTSFSLNSYNRLPIQEKIVFNAGGIEANDVLVRQIRLRWLNACFIDSREANLYHWAFIDQVRAIWNSHTFDHTGFPPDGHEIPAYINNVNRWYQGTTPVLTARKLRHRVWLNFIDPFFFYSLFSMGLYIVEGNQTFEYPMIAIGQYRYLPVVRMELAPYGPEYHIINLIKGPNRVIQATARFSNIGGKNSQGISVEATRLFCADPLAIDGRVDLWRQPKILSDNSSLATPHLGAAITFIARYKLVPQLDLVGHAGYKTTGYIPGEILKHTPIIRFGFRVNL